VKKRNRFAIAFLLTLCTLFGWQGAEAAGVAADSISTTIVSHPKAKSSGIKHWRHVGGNRFCGNDKRAWRQHGLNKSEIAEMKLLVREKKFEWVVFANEQKFLSVSFGQNGLWKSTVADWGSGKSYAARLYHLSSGKAIARVAWCRNWAVPVIAPVKRHMAGLEAIIKSVPLPEETPKIPEVISEATSEDAVCKAPNLDDELSVVAYVYGNKNVHGSGGAVHGVLIKNLNDGYQVGLGFRTDGTGGKLNSDQYYWKKHWAKPGPEVKLARYWENKSVMSYTSLIPGRLYEEGSADGWYNLHQRDNFSLNEFLEANIRLNPTTKVGGIVEITKSFGSHLIDPSSQYAEIKDLSSLYAGGYIEKKVTSRVAGRLQIGIVRADKLTSTKLEATVQIDDGKAYFGPGIMAPWNGSMRTFAFVAGLQFKNVVKSLWRRINGQVEYIGPVSGFDANNQSGDLKPGDY